MLRAAVSFVGCCVLVADVRSVLLCVVWCLSWIVGCVLCAAC